MPYIETHRRELLDSKNPEHDTRPVSAGELNYKITQLCLSYLTVWGISYTRINDVIGALDAAKMEFYRRVVVPYEDVKIEMNGDVYPEKFTKF
jgi:hypothetical protein